METTQTKKQKFLRRNLLIILTLLGVILGGCFGAVLKYSSDKSWSDREVMYVSFIGDIFLRVLKSLILPLIFASMVSAITNMDTSLSGKIATRAIIFYLISTFCSVVLGIILVTTIQPGYYVSDYNPNPAPAIASRNTTTVDTLMDLIRNLFPPNIVESTIAQTRTVLTPPKNNLNSSDILEWHIEHETVNSMNIMGLIVIATAIGVTLSNLGEEGRILAKFFDAVMATTMKLTSWIIWLSPVGVFFLVAAKIIEIDDIKETLLQLGLYFMTVIFGLSLQGFLILPLVYFLFTRQNPYKFILNISEALATAFGTSSSSATLPLTMKCLEEKNGVDKRISRFCLPIGCTINMDGTALYEAVAAIFIAQVRHVNLNLGNVVAISITATAASIGAAGIPQAGLVTMIMVLDTCGLPAEDISLILAVDWLLDRFRTTVNVIGDSIGAAIVAHLSRKEIDEIKQKEIQL